MFIGVLFLELQVFLCAAAHCVYNQFDFERVLDCGQYIVRICICKRPSAWTTDQCLPQRAPFHSFPPHFIITLIFSRTLANMRKLVKKLGLRPRKSDPNLQAQARAAGGTPESGSHMIGSDLLRPSSSSVQSPSPTAPRSRQNSPRPSIQHVLGNAPSVSTEMPVSSASDINLDSRTLPRPQISAGRTIVHGLKNGLQVATESADACPQLKSVLGFIRAIIKVSEVSVLFLRKIPS